MILHTTDSMPFRLSNRHRSRLKRQQMVHIWLVCHAHSLRELTPRSKGSLTVHHIAPPFPRSLKGKFHILFAHLRQLHLTTCLLLPSAPQYDFYFIDQLSTCIPFLCAFASTRVVFYCHFPDKPLANGEFVDGDVVPAKVGLLKSVYRYPMDRLEEFTTGAPFSCYRFAAQLSAHSPIPGLRPVYSRHISP